MRYSMMVDGMRLVDLYLIGFVVDSIKRLLGPSLSRMIAPFFLFAMFGFYPEQLLFRQHCYAATLWPSFNQFPTSATNLGHPQALAFKSPPLFSWSITFNTIHCCATFLQLAEDKRCLRHSKANVRRHNLILLYLNGGSVKQFSETWESSPQAAVSGAT